MPSGVITVETRRRRRDFPPSDRRPTSRRSDRDQRSNRWLLRLGAIKGRAPSAHRRGQRSAPVDAMLRARVQDRSDIPVRYLSSARSHEGLIYRSELESIASQEQGIEVLHTLTRSQPWDWTGLTGRVDRNMLARHAWPSDTRPLCYVCGPTGFVETVATTLVELGHEPGRVKTERFGPTGGA